MFELSSGARNGRPLVFVHGFGVSTRHLRPALAEFADAWDVWAFDLPGHGRSGRPRQAWGVEELAGFLARWLDARGFGAVPLIANSMGCQVAVELAAREPARVDRLVLVGPTYDPRAPRRPQQLARLAVDSLFEPPALNAVVVGDYLRAGPLRMLRTARLALEHPIAARLPLVEAPTLVVRGERDAIVSAAWARDVAASIPRARLVLVGAAAHAVHFSRPKALRAVAEPFLVAPRV